MAQFTNKFTVQIQGDGLSRIIFVDERATIEGAPPTHVPSADVIMKTSDLAELRDLLDELLRKHKHRSS